MTAVAAGVLGWIHWGLGLIAGALLAREVATAAKARGIPVHFPLLAAAGYIGLLVWHSGLSGSAPLLVNTEGHFAEEQIGIVSLADTILQPYNLLFVAVVLIVAPIMLAAMHPRADDVEEIEEERGLGVGDGSAPTAPGGEGGTKVEQEREIEVEALEPAQRLAYSRVLVGLVVLAGLVLVPPGAPG
jgi:short-chain fatty acids transporter